MTGTDGVTVNLTGDEEEELTMDNGGSYSFTVASLGTYTVSAIKEGYEFNVTSRTFESVIENRVQDFVTNPQTFTITGSVNGTDEVTVLLGGDSDEARITDEDGIYEFSVIDGGTYTLTPQKPGYSFEPVSVNFDSVTADITQDFAATLNSHTISGTVTGADDVTVQLSGNAENEITVDDGGSYSFTVDALGSYVVAVSCIGYQLTPDIKMFPNLLEDATQDFQAIQDTYTISGTVTGTDGVTVRLSGDDEDEVVVENDGTYSFAVLSLGTYTVSVEKERVSFPISQETFHYLLRDETHDFIAAVSDVIIISVLVTGLDDVTVQLSGDMDGKQIVGDNDLYQFTLERGGTYTVSVFKEACTFDTYEVTFENVMADMVQNFKGQLISEDVKSQFLSHVQSGNTAQINVMLDNMPFIHSVKDSQGWSPLHWAAYEENTEIIKLLLDRGADIKARNNGGDTPLHWAVYVGKTEIVQLLLDRGADIEAKNNLGDTSLHKAVKNGSTETVQLLLDKNANIETKNNDGDTPLHMATYFGKTEIVQLLLGRGADIEAKNNNDNTPLHLAVYVGKTQIVQILLNRDANVNALNNRNNTPLDYAVLYSYTEIAEILTAAGGKHGNEL